MPTGNDMALKFLCAQKINILFHQLAESSSPLHLSMYTFTRVKGVKIGLCLSFFAYPLRHTDVCAAGNRKKISFLSLADHKLIYFHFQLSIYLYFCRNIIIIIIGTCMYVWMDAVMQKAEEDECVN